VDWLIPGFQAVASVGPLRLKVRRLPDAVEGGDRGHWPRPPQLQQFNNKFLGWEATESCPIPPVLRRGPQAAWPCRKAGFETISLEGEGDRLSSPR